MALGCGRTERSLGMGEAGGASPPESIIHKSSCYFGVLSQELWTVLTGPREVKDKSIFPMQPVSSLRFPAGNWTVLLERSKSKDKSIFYLWIVRPRFASEKMD